MPTGTIHQPLAHTFAAPRFEDAAVVDAMRVGVVSCPPDAPLREVARTMATYRIHCVVVSELDGGAPLGVVSDIDIATAASSGTRDQRAGAIARTEPVSVAPTDTLQHAAQLMAEHDVSHLVVIQPQSGHPVGVLSALDLAGVLAWGGTASR